MAQRKASKKGRPASDLDLATRRYIGLIEWLGRMYGRRDGWQSFAATQLGVSRAYISQLLSGRHGKIGSRALKLAAQRIPGVTADYFRSEGEPAPLPADEFQKRFALGQSARAEATRRIDEDFDGIADELAALITLAVMVLEDAKAERPIELWKAERLALLLRPFQEPAELAVRFLSSSADDASKRQLGVMLASAVIARLQPRGPRAHLIGVDS